VNERERAEPCAALFMVRDSMPPTWAWSDVIFSRAIKRGDKSTNLLTKVQNDIRAVAVESCLSLDVCDKLFGTLNQPMDRVDFLWVDGPTCWCIVEGIPRARRRNSDAMLNSQIFEQKDN
jgi:hypothetical protein